MHVFNNKNAVFKKYTCRLKYLTHSTSYSMPQIGLQLWSSCLQLYSSFLQLYSIYRQFLSWIHLQFCLQTKIKKHFLSQTRLLSQWRFLSHILRVSHIFLLSHCVLHVVVVLLVVVVVVMHLPLKM